MDELTRWMWGEFAADVEAMERKRYLFMGNWHISIEGVGMHHNPDEPRDADKIARRFVAELENAGHSVSHATFTHGGSDSLSRDEPHGGTQDA